MFEKPLSDLDPVVASRIVLGWAMVVARSVTTANDYRVWRALPRDHVRMQCSRGYAHVHLAAAARVTANRATDARVAANRATHRTSRRGGGVVLSHRLTERGGRQHGPGRHKRQNSESRRENQGSSHSHHY